MGQSRQNPQSNDYRGPAKPSKVVAFQLIEAPCEAWTERNKAAIEAGNPPECPPEEMRIGIMLCIAETVKSPLKMVPDKTVIFPCGVVFSTSMDAYEANKLTPEQLRGYVDGMATKPMPKDGEQVTPAMVAGGEGGGDATT